MSFLNSAPIGVRFNIRRGYSYGERTFQYGREVDGEFVVDENDGWEAHLEVACTKDGEPVLVLDSTDVDGPLTIDPDVILVELSFDPGETSDMDFSCCDFVLFLYKGDVDDPSDKKPFLFGEFRVV